MGPKRIVSVHSCSLGLLFYRLILQIPTILQYMGGLSIVAVASVLRLNLLIRHMRAWVDCAIGIENSLKVIFFLITQTIIRFYFPILSDTFPTPGTSRPLKSCKFEIPGEPFRCFSDTFPIPCFYWLQYMV